MRDNRGTVHWTTFDAAGKAGLLHKGHHLYMDNYFSFLTLLEDLAAAETGECGTLRKNCTGTPQFKGCQAKKKKKKRNPTVMTTTLGRYEPLFMTWMDRNLVTLVTTIHNDTTFMKRTCCKDSATRWQECDKPYAIEAYTTYMRGVDLVPD